MILDKTKNNKQFSLLAELLIILIFGFSSCQENQSKKNVTAKKLNYVLPVDSISFNYKSPSWKRNKNKYIENRFGKKISIDTTGNFRYITIDSENELHTFNFKTSIHTYSKPICDYKIDAYLIQDSLIYLLYNNVFYVKNFQLKTIDSFVYNPPNITQKHGIDFSIENNSNLFRINNYYVLMYYIVDKNGAYRNSKYLFYYFNKTESFFTNKMCAELDSTFQYFRYPAVTSSDGFLYHSPRILNCISKSNNIKTFIHVPIDNVNSNYLSLNYGDQFQVSKLKKYRFSSDYNRDIIIQGNNCYLLKEFLNKMHIKNNVKTYDLDLELIKFNKALRKTKTLYIKDNVYYSAFIKDSKLYLFNFQKNKCYIYEI